MAGMYWLDQISQRKSSVWGTPAARDEPAVDDNSWFRRENRNGPAMSAATMTSAPSHLSALRRCPYWEASTIAPIKRHVMADSSAVRSRPVRPTAATIHRDRRRGA